MNECLSVCVSRQVNEKLLAMDVKFMDGKSGPKNYDAVGSGDVVILPAFGATIQEMQLLDEKYYANPHITYRTYLQTHRTYIHTYIHTYMHTYIHFHTYIHILGDQFYSGGCFGCPYTYFKRNIHIHTYTYIHTLSRYSTCLQ